MPAPTPLSATMNKLLTEASLSSGEKLALRSLVGVGASDAPTLAGATLPDPEPVPRTAEQIAEQERQAAEMEVRMTELEAARNLPRP